MNTGSPSKKSLWSLRRAAPIPEAKNKPATAKTDALLLSAHLPSAALPGWTQPLTPCTLNPFCPQCCSFRASSCTGRKRAIWGEWPRDALTLGVSVCPWGRQETRGEAGFGSYILFNWVMKKDGDTRAVTFPRVSFIPQSGSQHLYLLPCASNPQNLWRSTARRHLASQSTQPPC